MPEDKRFRVSVDDRQLQTLRSSAEGLARDLIRSSRQYSTSSKEVLKDLEEQIKLIEKRNSLDDDLNRQRLESSRKAGTISESQYQGRMQAAAQGSNEDRIQIQLLREIVDTIKSTSKDEIRQDRVGVEKSVRESKRVESLRPEGDEFDILRETIQYGLIGEVSDEERDQRTKFRDRGVRYGRGANQMMGMTAGAQNEFYLAASAIAWIPMVGQGLSQLTNRVIGSASKYEKSLSSLSAFYNTNVDAVRSMLPGRGVAASLGMSRGDFAEREFSLQEAAGGRLGTTDVVNMLAAERVRNIRGGTLRSLAGVARYGTGYTESGREQKPGDIIEVFEKSSRGNNTILNEMLNTFIQTANNITSISRGVDMGQTAISIAGISQATGAEGAQLGRVVQGIQGMGRSSSPVVRSMMLRSMRRAEPRSSFFDVQAMMENPLENIEAMSSMFKNLKGMSGGGDLYKQALFSTFGGTLSRTDIIDIMSRGGGFEDIAKKAKEADVITDKDFTEKLSNVIGKIEKSSANVESMAQDTGKWVVDFMDKAFGQIQKGMEKLGGDPEDAERRSYETQKRAYKDGMQEFHSANPIYRGL